MVFLIETMLPEPDTWLILNSCICASLGIKPSSKPRAPDRSTAEVPKPHHAVAMGINESWSNDGGTKITFGVAERP